MTAPGTPVIIEIDIPRPFFESAVESRFQTNGVDVAVLSDSYRIVGYYFTLGEHSSVMNFIFSAGVDPFTVERQTYIVVDFVFHQKRRIY